MGSDDTLRPARRRGWQRMPCVVASLLLSVVLSGWRIATIGEFGSDDTHPGRSPPVLQRPDNKAQTLDVTAQERIAISQAQPRSCALDVLDGGQISDQTMAQERFLVYAPQFGLSNQIVALRNAVMWALLLNRTLVLPHLLGHGTADAMALHSAAFDVMHAERVLAPELRLEEMPSFLARHLRPRHVVALDTSIKMRAANDAYFTALGVDWHSAVAPMKVTMTNFTPATIRATFGDCTNHRVLAFRSLFAALDLKEPKDFLASRMAWLDRIAMPALLRPAPGLAAVVDRLVSCLTSGCGQGATDPPSSRPMIACAHIRQGDFDEECAKYEKELASKRPRPWLLSHARRGYSCLQNEDTLVSNLRGLRQKAVGGLDVPIYASIEDAAFLKRPSLRPFNMTSLSELADIVRATSREQRLQIPDSIGNVLIDQMVCGRAKILLLNAFSTFSQMVIARVGLGSLGWARDLSPTQQRQLGVTINFWQTDYWARRNYVSLRTSKHGRKDEMLKTPKTLLPLHGTGPHGQLQVGAVKHKPETTILRAT